MNRFPTPLGEVGWETDARGLSIDFRGHTKQVPWAEISAAGLVRFSGPNIPAGMPLSILPGLGKLVDLDRQEAQALRQLVLARGRSPFRAVRIPIPTDKPEAAALAEAAQQKLGERWIGEVAMEDHQAALGLSTPWWFYLVFGFGMVAFGLTILLALGAFESLSSGQVAGVPPLAWLALLFWLLLVGGILFLYRQRG